MRGRAVDDAVVSRAQAHEDLGGADRGADPVHAQLDDAFEVDLAAHLDHRLGETEPDGRRLLPGRQRAGQAAHLVAPSCSGHLHDRAGGDRRGHVHEVDQGRQGRAEEAGGEDSQGEDAG